MFSVTKLTIIYKKDNIPHKRNQHFHLKGFFGSRKKITFATYF